MYLMQCKSIYITHIVQCVNWHGSNMDGTLHMQSSIFLSYYKGKKNEKKSSSSIGSTSGLRPATSTKGLLSSTYEHSFHFPIMIIPEK